MTDRLYYRDPYLREFDAVVTRVDRADGRLVVALDRTCFYPTSGGQPFDIGTLGRYRVVDVIDEDSGAVGHVLDASDPNNVADTAAPGPHAGERVHGVVDWPRRFDHMQQHTGQHLLSAAFDRLFKVRTVSFHLGAAASTIDLAREVTAKEIAAAEGEANDVIWQDRAIAIRFATAEEAARLPLRKEPARAGLLRLIDVEDFDLSACGGTHVARTGAVGAIVVGSSERFKGGSRIEFFCGGRAVKRFRALRDTVSASTRLLSAAVEDLPASIERLQSDMKEQRRTLAALQVELAGFRAGELTASSEPTPAGRIVVRAIDADAQGLKALASAVCARGGLAAVLVSTARPALAVVCRSVDVAAVNAKDVLAALTSKFGGRGGGSPEIAQGGGLDAAPDAILAEARRLLSLGD